MKVFPAYYEWHLTDDNFKLIFALNDPSENLYWYEDEDLNKIEEPIPMTLEEVQNYIEFAMREAVDEYHEWQDGSKWNISEEQIAEGSKLMAQVLYDYYLR